MNTALLIGAGAAVAYYYRDSILTAFGPTTATPSAVTTAQIAATQAAATGATPAVQAAIAQAAVVPTLIAPTIPVDNPMVHSALTAYATANSAASLARAQGPTGYNGLAADYLLNVSQWNWYHTASGLTDGIITSATEAGDNAISAEQYLALRQARGLV